MKATLILLLIFTWIDLKAQLYDDFADADFISNPTWAGDDASFQITGNQLQSNGPAATASIDLSVPNTKFSGMQWEFYVHLTFSPSDANHAKIYLMSDQADLASPILNGYFIRVGENGSADGVDLWKQTGSSFTKILDGVPGSVAVNPTVRIRVIRDVTGNWQVYADPTGEHNFTLQGSTFDEDITRTTHFGFACVHTTTNRQRFFFDDVSIMQAPIAALKAEALSATLIAVQFSRALSSASAGNLANYSIDKGVILTSATLDAADASQVLLALSTSLQPLTNYTLSLKDIQDTDNNVIESSTLPFTYVAAARYNDLVISEIFADETPSSGLPETEYIELYNRTGQALSLNQFRLADNNGFGVFPNIVLGTHEYLIVCANSSVSKLTSFGKAVGIANFSLNNSGEVLSLLDAKGRLIHSITYSDEWYHSTAKKEGGWSLEMIDLDNPCGEGANWTASEHPTGGTPGQVNSANAQKPDLTPPKLVSIVVTDERQIWAVFDEKLDSISASNLSLYQLDKNLLIKSASVARPDFKRVQLLLQTALQAKTVYTLTVSNLTDCNGNLATQLSHPFVLPQQGDSTDIIVNEVLFNPLSGGVDFVELYNRSGKYVTLAGWQLANAKEGKTADAKLITSENSMLAPQQYLLLSTDPALVKNQYPKAKIDNAIRLVSFPSYSDESGTVVLLNNLNKVMDRFDYNEDIHLPLLKNKEGVSLEKINFDLASNDRNSWQSAASTENYATPGYRNSQFRQPTENAGGIHIDPPVFTPDEDGLDDYTTLQYAFAQGGSVATIRIFDSRGRQVKQLAQNQTLGTEGIFRWDGTNDNGEKARVGYYIIHVELFDLSGKVKQYKEKVVVGAR